MLVRTDNTAAPVDTNAAEAVAPQHQIAWDQLSDAELEARISKEYGSGFGGSYC
jgi:hypothetical protein